MKKVLSFLKEFVEVVSIYASAFSFVCFMWQYHKHNYYLAFSCIASCIVFALWDIQKEIRDKNE